MLRIGARPVAPSATDYGAVSIRSEVSGAEILLDGGLVGRTSQDKRAFLRNVPVGDHDLRVRETSGRVARQMVRVRKDLTVLVAPGASLERNRLVLVGKNDRGYEEYRRKRDGAVMVKIPEGEFHMGNLETEGHPQPHTVYVSTFLMDKTPVTWGQYEKFLEATGWPLPPDEPYWGIHDDQPAVFVTWEESRAYCEWVGGRLPTEAEREKAARGTDERKYPWGDEEPNPMLATFRHNWGYVASTPVGSHPAGASPYGLLDMGGNVWEWCEDWFDPKYPEVSPKKDPRGPATGRSHVVKGGSWDSRPSVLSASSRNFGYLGYREGDFGFRCAADPP
jgi:formylglycine-generating enzyme required for sulfatase activity